MFISRYRNISWGIFYKNVNMYLGLAQKFESTSRFQIFFLQNKAGLFYKCFLLVERRSFIPLEFNKGILITLVNVVNLGSWIRIKYPTTFSFWILLQLTNLSTMKNIFGNVLFVGICSQIIICLSADDVAPNDRGILW